MRAVIDDFERLRRFLSEVEKTALRRPHDGSQIDEDLEGVLLQAREWVPTALARIEERFREAHDQRDALRAQVKQLQEALQGVASSVCSRLCPTTWPTAEGRRHHESCERVRDALEATKECPR